MTLLLTDSGLNLQTQPNHLSEPMKRLATEMYSIPNNVKKEELTHQRKHHRANNVR